MKPFKMKLVTSISLLIFFLVFFAHAEICVNKNNCSRNDDNSAKMAIETRDIFSQRRIERESRMVNIRERIGSERLVNNRRIVDSDSRLSNFLEKTRNVRENIDNNNNKRNTEERRDSRSGQNRIIERKTKNFDRTLEQLTTLNNPERFRGVRELQNRVPEIAAFHVRIDRETSNDNKLGRLNRRNNFERAATKEQRDQISDTRTIRRVIERAARNPETQRTGRNRINGISRSTDRVRLSDRVRLQDIYETKRVRTSDERDRTDFLGRQNRIQQRSNERTPIRDAERIRTTRIVQRTVTERTSNNIETERGHNTRTNQNRINEISRNTEKERLLQRRTNFATEKERNLKSIPNRQREPNSFRRIVGQRTERNYEQNQNTRSTTSEVNRNTETLRFQHSETNVPIQNRITERNVRKTQETRDARFIPNTRQKRASPMTENKREISRVADDNNKVRNGQEKRALQTLEIRSFAGFEKTNERRSLTEQQTMATSRRGDRLDIHDVRRENQDQVTNQQHTERNSRQDERSADRNTAMERRRTFRARNILSSIDENNNNLKESSHLDVVWSKLLSTIIGILLIGQIVHSKMDSKGFNRFKNFFSGVTKEKIH